MVRSSRSTARLSPTSSSNPNCSATSVGRSPGPWLPNRVVSSWRPAAGMRRDARDHLLAYAWPGNVRELRNAIERAVILADGGVIGSEHLPVGQPRAASNGDTAGQGGQFPAGGVNLEAIERSLVVK